MAFGQATSTIQLPAGFTASVLSIANDTISNLGGYIGLILGVLLATVVIGILIGAIRKD